MIVRGHHIAIRDMWTPVVHENLSCRREGETFRFCTIAIVQSGSIIHWLHATPDLHYM